MLLRRTLQSLLAGTIYAGSLNTIAGVNLSRAAAR